jgi:ABC-type antimicrobial peptide transport system permease subunit
VSAHPPYEDIEAYNNYPFDKMYEISKEVSYKLSDSLNKMPGVIEANPSDYNFSRRNTTGYSMYLSPNTDSINNQVTDLRLYDIGNESYGFSVLEGSLPEKELAADEIVISECVCRAFGLENPIGKKLYRTNMQTGSFESFNIVAVVSDIYLKGPFADPDPVVFIPKSSYSVGRMVNHNVTVKYNNDFRKELSELTDSVFEDSNTSCSITYMDDWFAEFMKPSNDLFKIFSIISIVCMLIAVSGVYSIITLTCRERRREIAVRKVHGAKVRDILSIFAREYGKILLITYAFAFGVGYVVMHQWVQQFQKQAPISWWIYAVIIVGMALLICLTVIERVLSTARENPAEVIKSE